MVTNLAGKNAGQATEVEPTATFGLDHWYLGLLAAVPALVLAVAFIACAGVLRLVPALPVGPVVGVVLVLLILGAGWAHWQHYPAWTQPGIVLIPTLLIFVPTVLLQRQLLWQVNGDTDRVVLAPLVVCLVLLFAGVVSIVGLAIIIGRSAPSLASVSVLPLPLLLSWGLLLDIRYTEQLVLAAIGSALALVAFVTFVTWLTPQQQRPFVPLLAVVAQLGVFWLQHFGWPQFAGLVRWIVGVNLVLLVLLVLLLGLAPLLAAWMRRVGWPVIEQYLV